MQDKGAFTLGRFCARFCTKLAHLVMKKNIFVSKMCKLITKSRAKIANVNAPKRFIYTCNVGKRFRQAMQFQ